jgi:hypothetical protein
MNSINSVGNPNRPDPAEAAPQQARKPPSQNQLTGNQAAQRPDTVTLSRTSNANNETRNHKNQK